MRRIAQACVPKAAASREVRSSQKSPCLIYLCSLLPVHATLQRAAETSSVRQLAVATGRHPVDHAWRWQLGSWVPTAAPTGMRWQRGWWTTGSPPRRLPPGSETSWVTARRRRSPRSTRVGKAAAQTSQRRTPRPAGLQPAEVRSSICLLALPCVLLMPDLQQQAVPCIAAPPCGCARDSQQLPAEVRSNSQLRCRPRCCFALLVRALPQRAAVIRDKRQLSVATGRHPVGRARYGKRGKQVPPATVPSPS